MINQRVRTKEHLRSQTLLETSQLSLILWVLTLGRFGNLHLLTQSSWL